MQSKNLKKYKHIINVSPVIKILYFLDYESSVFEFQNIALVNPDIIPSILPLVHGQYVSDTSNIMITKNVIQEIDGIYGHYDQVKQKYIEAVIEPDVMKKYVEKGID